jgi:hypothetical protein
LGETEFSLRFYDTGHLVDPNNFYLVFVPARIEYVGPIMGTLALPNNRVPVVRERLGKTATYYSLEPTLRKSWRWLERQLSMVQGILRHFASPYDPLLDLDARPLAKAPASTNYHEPATSEKQVIGRTRHTRDLFILLNATITYYISLIPTPKDYVGKVPYWEYLVLNERVIFPDGSQGKVEPTFLDELRASHIPRPDVLRLGGWIEATSGYSGGAFQRFVASAARWNVPVVIEFPRAQIAHLQANHPSDSMLEIMPTDRDIEAAVNFTAMLEEEIHKMEMEMERERAPPPNSPRRDLTSQYRRSPPPAIDFSAPPPSHVHGLRPGEHPTQFFTRRKEEFNKAWEGMDAAKRAVVEHRRTVYDNHPEPSKNGGVAQKARRYFEWDLHEDGSWSRTSVSRTRAANFFFYSHGNNWIFNPITEEVDICEGLEDEITTDIDPFRLPHGDHTSVHAPADDFQDDQHLGPFAYHLWRFRWRETGPAHLFDHFSIWYGFRPTNDFQLPASYNTLKWKPLHYNHNPGLPPQSQMGVDLRTLRYFHDGIRVHLNTDAPSLASVYDLDPMYPVSFAEAYPLLRAVYVTHLIYGNTSSLSAIPVYAIHSTPQNRDFDDADYEITVEGATSALGCIRLVHSSPEAPKTKRALTLYLAQHGISFRTFSWDPEGTVQNLTVDGQYVPKGLGIRPPEYKPTLLDFHAYESALHAFFGGTRARAALKAGGLIWRIAVQYLSPEHVLQPPLWADPDLLREPTHVTTIPMNGTHYSDDDITDSEKDLICGVYQIVESKANANDADTGEYGCI